jgi:hypothetical protein
MPTPHTPPATAAPPPSYVHPLPSFCGPTAEAVAALDKAISLARPTFGPLTKNETADIKGRKHGYLNLPGLYDAVVAALLTQGVVVSNSIQHVAGGFLIITTLHDTNLGGWRISEFPIVNLSGGSSAIAAAATTAPRINLQLLLGICAQDDEVEAPAAAVAPWNAPAAAGGSWEVPAMPVPPVPGAALPLAAAGQPFPGGYDPSQGHPQTPPHPLAYQQAPQQAAPQQQANPYAQF